jgi:SGNH domain (fused to AT3 domains)
MIAARSLLRRSGRGRGSVVAVMLLAVALLPGWAMAHRDGSACAGAAALPNHCQVPDSGTYVPDAAHAEADHVGDGLADGCWTSGDFTQFHTCTVGSPQAKYTVALVGNSHAAQWLAPLRSWADQYDMRVVAYLIPKCFAIDEKIDIADSKYGPVMNDRCYAWGKWVQRETNKLKPDLIVTTERTYKTPIPVGPGGQWQTWKAGYQRYLRGWTGQGRHLLIIRDNPVPGTKVPECLQAHPQKFSACAGERKKWLPPDALIAAAGSLHSPLITTVDLSNHMCTATECPPVIGGVCVYRDHSHMTATWIRSLQTFLEGPFAAGLHHGT